MTDGQSECCEWNGPWQRTSLPDDPLVWTDDEKEHCRNEKRKQIAELQSKIDELEIEIEEL